MGDKGFDMDLKNA